MPIVLRSIEPVYLSKAPLNSSVSFDLGAVTNNTLSGTILQLSSLLDQADGLFSELGKECRQVYDRAENLKTRIHDVGQKVSALDFRTVKIPENSLDDENKLREFYAAKHGYDTNLFTSETRSLAIQEMYDDSGVSPVKIISSCNQFRHDGYTGSRIFSRTPVVAEEPFRCPEIDFIPKRPFLYCSYDREPSKVLTIERRPHSADFLDEIDKCANTDNIPLPTPEEQIREMSKSQPSNLVPIDVTGSGFTRMCSYRTSLKSVEYLDEDTERRRRKRNRRRTISEIPNAVSCDLTRVENTAPRSTSAHSLRSSSDRRHRSRTLEIESLDYGSSETLNTSSKSEDKKKKKWSWFGSKKDIKMFGSKKDIKIKDSKSKNQSVKRSESLPRSLTSSTSTREPIIIREKPRESHKFSLSNLVSSVRQSMRRSKSMSVVKPKSKNYDIEKQRKINEHNNLMARQEVSKYSQVKLPNSHEEPRYATVGNTTVKLRESTGKLSKDERQSSSGNWSLSTSARHSMESDWTQSTHSNSTTTSPKHTQSQSSFDKDSAVSLSTYPSPPPTEDRFPSSETTSCIAETPIEDDSTLVGDDEDASTIQDGGNSLQRGPTVRKSFTKMSTEAWLKSLERDGRSRSKSRSKSLEKLPGLKAVLSQENLLAYDEQQNIGTQKYFYRTKSRNDDEVSSVHSCDMEGFYTSMHTDSGLSKRLAVKSAIIPKNSKGVLKNQVKDFNLSMESSTPSTSSSVNSVVLRSKKVEPPKIESVAIRTKPQNLAVQKVKKIEKKGAKSHKIPPPPPPRLSTLSNSELSLTSEMTILFDKIMHDKTKSSSSLNSSSKSERSFSGVFRNSTMNKSIEFSTLSNVSTLESDSDVELNSRLHSKTTMDSTMYSLCSVSPIMSEDEEYLKSDYTPHTKAFSAFTNSSDSITMTNAMTRDPSERTLELSRISSTTYTSPNGSLSSTNRYGSLKKSHTFNYDDTQNDQTLGLSDIQGLTLNSTDSFGTLTGSNGSFMPSEPGSTETVNSKNNLPIGPVEKLTRSHTFNGPPLSSSTSSLPTASQTMTKSISFDTGSLKKKKENEQRPHRRPLQKTINADSPYAFLLKSGLDYFTSTPTKAAGVPKSKSFDNANYSECGPMKRQLSDETLQRKRAMLARHSSFEPQYTKYDPYLHYSQYNPNVPMGFNGSSLPRNFSPNDSPAKRPFLGSNMETVAQIHHISKPTPNFNRGMSMPGGQIEPTDFEFNSNSWPRSPPQAKATYPSILKNPSKQHKSRPPRTLNFAPIVNMFDSEDPKQPKLLPTPVTPDKNMPERTAIPFKNTFKSPTTPDVFPFGMTTIPENKPFIFTGLKDNNSNQAESHVTQPIIHKSPVGQASKPNIMNLLSNGDSSPIPPVLPDKYRHSLTVKPRTRELSSEASDTPLESPMEPIPDIPKLEMPNSLASHAKFEHIYAKPRNLAQQMAPYASSGSFSGVTTNLNAPPIGDNSNSSNSNSGGVLVLKNGFLTMANPSSPAGSTASLSSSSSKSSNYSNQSVPSAKGEDGSNSNLSYAYPKLGANNQVKPPVEKKDPFAIIQASKERLKQKKQQNSAIPRPVSSTPKLSPEPEVVAPKAEGNIFTLGGTHDSKTVSPKVNFTNENRFSQERTPELEFVVPKAKTTQPLRISPKRSMLPLRTKDQSPSTTPESVIQKEEHSTIKQGPELTCPIKADVQVSPKEDKVLIVDMKPKVIKLHESKSNIPVKQQSTISDKPAAISPSNQKDIRKVSPVLKIEHKTSTYVVTAPKPGPYMAKSNEKNIAPKVDVNQIEHKAVPNSTTNNSVTVKAESISNDVKQENKSKVISETSICETDKTNVTTGDPKSTEETSNTGTTKTQDNSESEKETNNTDSNRTDSKVDEKSDKVPNSSPETVKSLTRAFKNNLKIDVHAESSDSGNSSPTKSGSSSPNFSTKSGSSSGSMSPTKTVISNDVLSALAVLKAKPTSPSSTAKSRYNNSFRNRNYNRNTTNPDSKSPNITRSKSNRDESRNNLLASIRNHSLKNSDSDRSEAVKALDEKNASRQVSVNSKSAGKSIENNIAVTNILDSIMTSMKSISKPVERPASVSSNHSSDWD
ncbi:unnamed protein product [Owenia fusiformis]|uniref:WASP family protein member n=1 Tax=Owenia fusiformis TaxID=6347 RepID=A0A8S4PYD2_OWEFU|nr:unnamed protein product [Owenia fusiformis]